MRALFSIFTLLFPVLAYCGIAVYEKDTGKWVALTELDSVVGRDVKLAYFSIEGNTCSSFVESIRVSNKNLRCKKPSLIKVHWFMLKPELNDYNNEKICSDYRMRCVEKIKYKTIKLDGNISGTIKLSKNTTHNPGTYRIIYSFQREPQVEIKNIINTVNKARQNENVIRIRNRKDDTYVGFLSEMFNVPFVYFPRYLPNNKHQTDQMLGADCVALVIYGQRRLGRNIPYVSPTALKKYLHLVKENELINVGDVLHFGFQTAVVSKDNPPLGELTGNDLITHTYHEKAEEIQFSQLPYKSAKYKVYRWKI